MHYMSSVNNRDNSLLQAISANDLSSCKHILNHTLDVFAYTKISYTRRLHIYSVQMIKSMREYAYSRGRTVFFVIWYRFATAVVAIVLSGIDLRHAIREVQISCEIVRLIRLNAKKIKIKQNRRILYFSFYFYSQSNTNYTYIYNSSNHIELNFSKAWQWELPLISN